MSSSDKVHTGPVRLSRRSALLALPALAACGFEPALAPGGRQSDLRDRVALAEPQNRTQFVLHAELQNGLGRAQTPVYRLAYALNTSERGAGITPDQQTTRINVLGAVDYTLRDIATDVVLASNTVESFTSFATTGTTAGTVFARRDAYERLMSILADLIVTDLTLKSDTWAP